MRILGIERDSSACNYYRIFSPLNAIDRNRLGECKLISERDLGTDFALESVLWADVVLFQRPHTENWFKFIKTCQKHGKTIISDYDDDPFHCSPLNPFYQYIGTEPVEYTWPDGTKEWLWSEDMVSSKGNKIFEIERNINYRDMFRLNFKKSDLVTCTTDILRNEFLKVNPNVAILPNCIDSEFFPDCPNFVKDEVRIGWQGGYSHYEDLHFIVPVVKRILEKHKNVKFVYFGDTRFAGLFKDCPQNQMEYQSWISHDVYPWKLTILNLDIGLCPVMDNPFNRTKSAIKWMEYSMIGMATVASDIPPYSPVISNEQTAMLCKENHDSWFDAIEKLVIDKQFRNKMAKTAFSEVILEHNIDSKAHLWVEAYEKILRPVGV